MNYQDVIKDSKFYLPMNLNLGYLLKDTEIVMLMNVINCDNIHEKLSVRKLMRFTNRSNNTVQNALNTLRYLKLIDGFTPNYETLKYVFDALNNAPSIEERIKWCEVYQKSIQQSVSETGTENVSETGTQIKKMEKEDINKKDLNIYKKNVILEGVEDCGFEWEDIARGLNQRLERTSTLEDLKKQWNEINEFLSTNADSIPSKSRECFRILFKTKHKKEYSLSM